MYLTQHHWQMDGGMGICEEYFSLEWEVEVVPDLGTALGIFARIW